MAATAAVIRIRGHTHFASVSVLSIAIGETGAACLNMTGPADAGNAGVWNRAANRSTSAAIARISLHIDAAAVASPLPSRAQLAVVVDAKKTDRAIGIDVASLPPGARRTGSAAAIDARLIAILETVVAGRLSRLACAARAYRAAWAGVTARAAIRRIGLGVDANATAQGLAAWTTTDAVLAGCTTGAGESAATAIT
jgi:hypothetical protein